MSQITRPRPRPDPGATPSRLRVYPHVAPAPGGDDRAILIDVLDPACYRLRLYSARERALMGPADVPRDLLRSGDVWFTFDAAPVPS